ncbi:hypothetical protein [Streptomyces sp. 3N207]|uniref:hypothetical protein n=1 Tax=Streptomyces sp. 3N207 TaxID=3457417 RepID=UPI003FCFE9B2
MAARAAEDPGREIADVVEATRDGVVERRPGRRVAACLGPAGGGDAELAVRGHMADTQ